MPDPAPLLTIYFRPCRVCGMDIGCLEHDLTPICQDCEAKQDKSPPERADA